MAQQIINTGTTDNDGTGDELKSALDKANDNFTELYDSLVVAKQVIVTQKSDFPDPVAGVISLASDTQYLLKESIDLGADRLVFGSNTVLSGIASLNIVISYSGTGDMFTMSNIAAQVNDLTIVCASGRVFNYSATSLTILRVFDCTISCSALGLFNGSGVGYGARFQSVTVAFTSSGFVFTGQNRSFNVLNCAFIPTAGTYFDFGTSTTDSFYISNVVGNLPTGTTFISGTTASGNVNTEGRALVVDCQLQDTGGTQLSGVSIDDFRWEFFRNTPIQDTKPDALVYSSSALTTTISVAETYVKANATWGEELASQFSTDSTGRITWNGEKPLKVPLTMSLSVAPVSGTNKTIRTRVVVNGDPTTSTSVNSTRSTRTDNGDASSITTPWQLVLQPGDYIEGWVTSADATNVIVSGGIMRVN